MCNHTYVIHNSVGIVYYIYNIQDLNINIEILSTVHIFMDDAFEVSDHSADDSQVNRFVQCLVDTIDVAASDVHHTNIKLRAPKKYPTPYGGRLVWTLPGKNKMFCHLKDKSKIRHRKRWSQVILNIFLVRKGKLEKKNH